jgi:RHS repeat-associated protein
LTTEYAYDKAGRPVVITDAKGGAKALVYTPQGQLSSYTDCSGQTSRWVYDERGRLKESIDAQGNSTRYRYTDIGEQHMADWETPNHAGQLAAVIQADGTEEHLVHDAEGRLLSHTDALEQRTRYSYTAAGLIEQRKDALGQTLHYRWDRLGRLSELRNENDRAYRFEYDPVGRLLGERGFDDQTTTYRYEESTGVLSEVIEGLQKPEAPDQPETYALRTKLEFDTMGRLTERRALVPGQTEQAERFAYNANGQLIQADNAHSKLQWFFDAAGNLVREHHHDLSQKQTAIWRHRYDELNQRVGTTRPDGHTLEWLTYGSGHVHGLVLDGQERVGFERDELHREIQRSQGNGVSQQQRFDAVGRLLEQSVVGKSHPSPMEVGHGAFQHKGVASATVQPTSILRRYKYDKAGQLTVIDDTRRGHMEYRYDPVGRLLKAQSAMGYETFAFDPAGNIQQPKDTYRDQGRGITGNKVMDNLIKEYAGTHYQYDERGNLIERLHQGSRTVFEWDAFNRMTTARTAKGTASFTYDPLGRRISKHYQPSDIYQGAQPSKHTVFGWDGDTLAYESNVQDGPMPEADTVHYIHEAGSFVPLMQARRPGKIKLKPTTDVKALMAANEGSYDIALDPLWNDEADEEPQAFDAQELVYYQCDHLGTPQELTDSEGQVAWAASYKAWGQARVVISDAARKAGIQNHIRFQGQYFDEETGLAYNRFRFYDPHSGRFVSKDPIGLLGGLNLQQYAPNPTEWVDPFGLQATVLPAYRNSELPSPYSHLEDGPTVGPGKDFTAAQKKKILDANRAANGGRLRCDLSGRYLTESQKSQSGVTPSAHEAQVDHIRPRQPKDSEADAGTNSYSNARVISRKINRQKSNNG